MNIPSQTQSQSRNRLAQFSSNSFSDQAIAIGDNPLNIDQVVRVARYGAKVLLTEQEEVLQQVQASCDWVAEAVASGQPIYGVTSGFGGMTNVVISPDLAKELQNNLMRYHKVGAGQKLSLTDVFNGSLSHSCRTIQSKYQLSRIWFG